MRGIYPQTDCLWGLVWTIADKLLCRGWPHRAGFALVGLWFLLSLSFGYVIYGAGCMVLWCGLKQATSCVGSGASREGLWCRPSSAAAFAFPGPPSRSCKVTYISRWLLLMLSLQVFGRLSCEGWLLLVPSLGLLSKRYGACQSQMLFVWGLWTFQRFWECRSIAKTGHLYGKATGNGLSVLVGWSRVSWNHQGGVNSVRLMETQIWHLSVPAGGGLNKETVASARLLSGRKLPLQSSLWSQTIQFFLVYPWHL